MGPRALDLSLVLVSYNMARELPRTLYSLSREYQRGLEEIRYEVIVVDNGSDGLPALDGIGNAPVRLVQASVASRSPVPALNQGLALATGELVGAWIDGARMATPGLLASALLAAKTSERPVIATLNYRLGAKVHAGSPEAARAGDEALLAKIGWPQNGYDLFSIGTPEQAGGDAKAALLESNALFMPKRLWAELDYYDPAFDEAGGGFANPDIYSRAVSAPSTDLIRIVGEATFHQYHDGVTSADMARAVEKIKEGASHYKKVRGKPPKRITETGRIFQSPFGPNFRD